MKFLLVLLFLSSCTKTITTPDGKVNIDKSYKRYLLSKKLLKEQIEEDNEYCTKCGICYRGGKFGFSCLCSGRRYTRDRYKYFEIIYEYKSDKHMKKYTTLPVETKEHIENLNKGSCK